MSQFKTQTKNVSFTIQDTDIMLKLLQSSQITGAEAKALSIVIEKVAKLQEKLVAKTVEV